MAELAAWCGFFGAWLLFAGPVYQAAFELRDQPVDRDAIASATAQTDTPPPVSAWWWLVPPIGYWLTRRRARSARTVVLHALDQSVLQQLVQFTDKAAGWLLIAAGAFLYGVQDTVSLSLLYRWPAPVMWVLVVLMPVLGASYTVFRRGRSQRVLGHSSTDARQVSSST